MKLLKIMLCKVVGHAGPARQSTVYEAGYVPGLENAASMGRIEWICPRCNGQAWGMALKSDPTPALPALRVVEKDGHEH